MENSLFTPCLDELFCLWKYTIHRMNYLVCTAGRYRVMSILGRVHAAFFNHHQFDAMTYMPDEIILVWMMTALYLGFEKAMHHHDKGYKSDNDYGLMAQVMRPVSIYSVFTTEGSFNPADYKGAQHAISPFMPR